MTTQNVTLRPVGHVVGGRSEMYEDDWHDVRAVIRLDGDSFTTSAVLGLEHFSHLEVVFLFDRVDPATVNSRPRPPRGNPDAAPVGVFAHRGPYRPNRLGVSRCRLLRVDGLSLHVADLDALSGSPVLDVKPYLVEFAPRQPIIQPAWATELMARYY
ncbi:SAM-dependent methyltransferase [Streptosporangium carneum]|uniref:tRNA (N6-threonylcarbamoyladenosine(37)-N6)-methyltransferase TrmO n=1 Tax=Streptosporangium carneum TaxID=47481 RepID=A0A9W6I827_9ACTN|nr:SAM-dependent methyltransferase [Streptosporangium carneum]GLK12680.1 tRNA (N6-threonylcarbamoyladenosine(37)-N6)-methyltransferase TrmO [Streptosporangium carneum]